MIINYIIIIIIITIIYSLTLLNYHHLLYYISQISVFLNSENFQNINFENKTILIYPHFPVDSMDGGGGIIVMYALAKILDENKINIKIYDVFDESNKTNHIFNKYTKDFDNDNNIVIYCEGTQGNPLDAKYTIRWILSKMGTNVPYSFSETWKRDELVYFFAPKFAPDEKKDIPKQLSIIYLDEKFINYNNKKFGYCHTFRKSHYHSNHDIIHPEDSFEIQRNPTTEELIDAFNKYEYFVSYDPATFLSILCLLCGCISIIHPVKNVDKKSYFSESPFGEFLKNNNIDYIYGIAYGIDDLDYAKETIHLAPELIKNSINYTNNKSANFIIDEIKNFDLNNNTVHNNY